MAKRNRASNFKNNKKTDRLPANLDGYLAKQYKRYIEGTSSQKAAAKSAIYKVLQSEGFYLSDTEYAPLKKAEKKLIRIEFYGSVDKVRNQSGFSKIYKDHLSSQNKENYPKEAYNDLCDWPIWQVCEQSKKLSALKPKIISYLQQNAISPEILPSLNSTDFQDILYNTFKVGESGKKAYLFESQRSRFVKYLANNYQKDLKNMFFQKGMSKDKVNELISKMKEYGSTEMHYIDPNGQIIQDKEIILTIHHKKPVASYSSKEKNIFSANDFKNLCLVINNHDFPLHDIFHIFNVKKRENDLAEQIIKKLLVPKDSVVMLGMASSMQIKESFDAEMTDEVETDLKACKNKSRHKAEEQKPTTPRQRRRLNSPLKRANNSHKRGGR